MPAGSGASPLRQLLLPGADAILRLVALSLVGVVLAASVGLYAWSHSDYVGGVGIAPEQPVPFSHKHHSGELGIDCRNCHQQVEYLASGRRPPPPPSKTCH